MMAALKGRHNILAELPPSLPKTVLSPGIFNQTRNLPSQSWPPYLSAISPSSKVWQLLRDERVYQDWEGAPGYISRDVVG